MTIVSRTADGSNTIYSERFGEHYHSKFSAANETERVFIEAGYLAVNGVAVDVLEIGFGSGLNALYTLRQAVELRRHTRYETIELFPIDEITARDFLSDELFLSLHTAPWERHIEIVSEFVLYKRKVDLLEATFSSKFDIVYFDAFSPQTQPEMWSEDVFRKIFAAMKPGAVLTTYCAKGDVRRTMQRVGFTVEKLKGPPAGKREMLRGTK